MATRQAPYDEETRRQVLAAYEANGRSVSQTSQDTGVARSTIRKWVRLAALGVYAKRSGAREADTSWWPTFLLELAATCSATKAIQAAGISRHAAYEHRDTFPEFAEAWQAAKRLGAEALEDEAVRRAYDGVKKPVFQGKELVGHVQVYSDTLLMFLLNGAMPEKYRRGLEVSGPGGGPIKVADDLTDEDRAAAVIALFDKARARRARQAADGGETEDE